MRSNHDTSIMIPSLRLLGITTLAASLLLACDPEGVEPSDEELLVAEDEDEAAEEAALLDPSSVPEPLADHEPSLDRSLDRASFDLTATPDVQAYAWKGWISDESPASTCGTGNLVSGFDCDGDHCDNVRIECHNYGGVLGDSNWSNWFSEEAPNNFYQCPGNQYVTGVTCSGGDCDNLSVECTVTSLAKTSCSWYGPYSEEQSAYYTYGNQAIAGIWCTGSNCDNKYYWVCGTT